MKLTRRTLFLVVSLTFLPTLTSAERLVSATVGLNYIGQGHCIVVNAGTDPADVTINIVQAASGAVVATTMATIPPGTSLTLPHQALTANFQDAYCEVTKDTEGAELRMVFKRVTYHGEVSEASDGLQPGAASANGNSSEPGSPGAKTIFLSSSRHDGNLGGRAGADAICQGLADAPDSVVPEGEYVALLHDGITPPAAALTPTAGPYLDTSGQPVAAGIAALFAVREGIPENNLLRGISLTEKGPQGGQFFTFVWTGSNVFGSARADCDNWTSGDENDNGQSGLATADFRWLEDDTRTCDNEYQIYCVQR